MVAIRTSLHGKLAGLGHDDAPVFKGDNITFDNDGTPITVPRADLAKLVSSARYVAVGAALTLTAAAHNGKTMLLDTAAGSVATLPAATGSGAVFRFLVTLVATSNSHKIQVANSSDAMIGFINGISDDPATVKGWIAAATSDTITLNRSTTGSVSKGEYIEIEDVAANVFAVRGWITQTGTEATPFSAAV